MIDFWTDWESKYRNACKERDMWKKHFSGSEEQLKQAKLTIERLLVLNVLFVGLVAYLIFM